MLELESASDAKLVVAIARWHEPALAEAYRRHGGAVTALARRVLGAQESAEDVTQEVFVGLWEQPERFDATRGGLRSFLLAAAHSRSVDLRRSQSARQNSLGVTTPMCLRLRRRAPPVVAVIIVEHLRGEWRKGRERPLSHS